ncbi:hypothetical protein K505DRAFT_351197 [Melanomma pulvis-pyrius CBS 109.77]|uniref:Aerobic respiration control sensor protein arcB n=1 Tax=Melanomma pulvis-pyrius CBS 109.77 TaxID=1314802 RepID=A0A6A6X633_9PLEO|nr:hypothetical protein K505DRAFT_351197 [Melanomma pulvis-pyrius CBS 109.77]
MSIPHSHEPPSPSPAQRYHVDVGATQRKLSIHIVEPQQVSSRADLAAFSLLEALDCDDRPTFAIDIRDSASASASSSTSASASTSASTSPTTDSHALLDVELVYCNPALAAADGLLAKIALFPDTPQQAFLSWLLGAADENDQGRRGKTHLFEGHIWATTTLGHLKIVSGVKSTGLRENSSSSPSSIDGRERKRPRYWPQMTTPPNVPPSTPANAPAPASYDYTLHPPPPNMSPHLLYFRSIDWARTSLGPMNLWSPQLRCIVNMMLNDSYPAVLFWGQRDVAMIYNEAYIQVIGHLHPCMGASARVAAKEYWSHLQPLVDHINSTGQTLSKHDMPVFLNRPDFLEETFFSFQFIPILDSAGQVAGYYQPLVETTKNNLLERRVSSLVEIGSQTAKARDLPTYWELVMDTLRISDKDAPFALLYAAEYEAFGDISSVPSPGGAGHLEQCLLKGSIGVEPGHPIAPKAINVKDGSNVFLPYLLNSAKSREPTLVHFDQLGLPESMLSGIDWKGYGDPCRCVIICPILPTTSEQVQGFLILGVNPRRPFDDDYQQFVQVLLRLLATSLASVVLFDEEIRQKENAIGQAAHIHEQLLSELKAKEKKFQRFAERADIAIFIIDPQTRKYIYRNQRWFDIFKFDINDTDDDAGNSWARIVLAEDLAACEAMFAQLVVERTVVSTEIKTKIPWCPPSEIQDPDYKPQEHFTWILCSAYPELGPDNEIVEIVGNVTDISKQKWAERMQKLRTESALESKKHLELFIDSTSHEMRNPLSAIMQCADGILSSCCFPDGDIPLPSPTMYASFIEQTLDAAQTIAQCVQHMKRIVDDILTISKLDSGLLVITPVDAQPERVAKHAVKMFEAEAKAAGIGMRFEVEQSYRDLAVDSVSLDPTRLLQVLINLITNAIKFTRLESSRLITVSIGASVSKPASTPSGVQFIDAKLVDDDRHLKDDWKHGSTLYIQFSVKDTGRGLSEEETSNLFARFSQASPRTHINYGGSGLGLFISRRLTEMQGGAIGLVSRYKKGSTFSFFIKARRTTAANRRGGSLPSIFPEDLTHRPGIAKEIEGLIDPSRPLIPRQDLNPRLGIPAQDPGHLPPPDLEELKGKNWLPETLHILVVEDNLVNQKVLAKQLRNLGCTVSVANHGGEALEFLKTTRYWKASDSSSEDQSCTGTANGTLPIDLSLILMDWEMPVMNGLTAVDKIRELERESRLTRHIPVIGVTANVRQQQIEMAMKAGMDDVVGKPFRVAELVERMRRVLEGFGMEGGVNVYTG